MERIKEIAQVGYLVAGCLVGYLVGNGSRN